MKQLSYNQLEVGMDVLAYAKRNHGAYLVVLRIEVVYQYSSEILANAYYHEQIINEKIQTRYDRYDITLENKHMGNVEWFQLNEEEVLSSIVSLTI